MAIKTHVNNFVKCQWDKSPNKKTQSGRLKNNKKKPTICCLQETHFRVKDTHRLEVADEKGYFMSKEMTRKWGLQYSYQTKQTLKQRPQRKIKRENE